MELVRYEGLMQISLIQLAGVFNPQYMRFYVQDLQMSALIWVNDLPSISFERKMI